MKMGILGSGMVGQAISSTLLAGRTSLIWVTSPPRDLEMYLPIWLRLWGGLQTPMFQFKVIR